mmetsp:Transcript_5979/g.12592  ORF Transcript_5979/g.12592 Transcript_5979/m.12592 type:complete len:353 (-) Transcript_5979:286-1344(-)
MMAVRSSRLLQFALYALVTKSCDNNHVHHVGSSLLVSAFAPAGLARTRSGPTFLPSTKSHYWLNGIDCVPVVIPNLPHIGNITILEATASAQDTLVDLALEDEEEMALSTAEISLPTGDPYGAVLWPAASVVAQTLLEELLLSNGKEAKTNVTILELGTGTGLVSLAALKAGCQQVIATDYEQLPLDLLDFAATHLNNETGTTTVTSGATLSSRLTCRILDMCDFENHPLPVVDYVVAADVMYEPKTGRAVAQRVLEALRNNSTVIVGDSPGRAGRPAFLQGLQPRLRTIDNAMVDFTTVPGWTVTGPRNPLICGPGSSSVSEESPQELAVAVLKLEPHACTFVPEPQESTP